MDKYLIKKDKLLDGSDTTTTLVSKPQRATQRMQYQDALKRQEYQQQDENRKGVDFDNEVVQNDLFQKQFEVKDGEIICKGKKKSTHSVKDGINHFLNLKVPGNVKELMSKLGISLEGFASFNFKLPKLPVLLMAASSNHYTELQGLLLDLKQKVVPTFPNIKLVIYDLGLTDKQFKQTLLKEYHFVMYMDASIRIIQGDLSEIFQYTLQNGLMLTPPGGPYEVLNNTDIRMFRFLHLNLCEYQGLIENQATMVIIADTWLTHWVLMKWWIVCALSEDCIAPPGTKQMLICPSNPMNSKIASCHRFDQSALNILTYSIFPEPKNLLLSPTYIRVLR
ncbi:hypothetical protein LOTGIDRAFT_154650 [Lottia gigantea]|uniref:Uncharacterized protein n=1 Tax=Lottia gigantea TaxID=225164 RepID=V3ZWZ6_LOTGI|nr:hypothetical protein LOTGIDRAFT_154650 [Lottia gigantea]ESO87150.1 hypothetical protein LOTGIDRAFT_154650 [Lottia gigantea]